MRVLIIEDERIVAADLQRMLRQLGYDAYASAPNASKALALAAETPPDVVLADVRIEGPVDGIDTAFQLRQQHGAAVVFLTAHADDPTVERAKHAEPCGYLIKPISAPAVKAAVELALDRRRREASSHVLERTLMETSADLLNALNHLPLAIQMEDAQGRVVNVNPAFRSLFGLPKDRVDLIGTDGADLTEYIQSLCRESERFGVIADCLRRSRQPTIGDAISLLDGRTLELDYVPLFLGGRRNGQLWTYRDISVSEHAREELEESAARQRQEILVDSLTGLASRRGFFQLSPTYLKLARCTAECKRMLFFIDLDGLKAINDRQGHAAGDEAICAVAQALRGTFRASDLLARLGGDEFVVLATMTPGDIESANGRLASQLEKFDGTVAPPYRLTVSTGMTEYLPGESLDTLVSRADAAMYREKRDKRTRESPRGQ